MKKTLALILTLVMILAIIPARADDTRTSGLYTYKIKGNGTITIIDFDWERNAESVFIPGLIDGYTVTGIADEAFKCEAALEKSFPVNIPNSVTSIGKFAFQNANISAINIPDELQLIGEGAFIGCPSCQFKVSPSHKKYAVINNALYDKTKKELIACYGDENHFEIPEGILSIGAYAMYQKELYRGYTGNEIVFPSTLENIGDYAFYGVAFDAEYYARKIQYQDGYFFPDGLTSIGDYAFANTHFNFGQVYIGPDLKIQIPDSVQKIGIGSFSNIESRTYSEEYSYIDIGENSQLKQIPEDAFRDSCLIIHVNGKLESIGAYAFSGGYEETKVSFVDLTSVTELGEGAFWDSSIYHPDELTYECCTMWSFDNPSEEPCTIALSENITVLPKYFSLWGTLPNTVKKISSLAYPFVVFDFYLPASVEEIEDNAFYKGSSFIVESGSYAELWCSENGFAYSIQGQDDISWLN